MMRIGPQLFGSFFGSEERTLACAAEGCMHVPQLGEK